MKDKLHAVLTIRLFTDKKCFGPGIAELLHRIDELHSLRSAAASIGMAYSKAWTIMKNAETGLGVKLLTSSIGGKNGGGATLTEEARKILENYEHYCRDLHAYAEKLFEERFKDYTN